MGRFQTRITAVWLLSFLTLLLFSLHFFNVGDALPQGYISELRYGTRKPAVERSRIAKVTMGVGDQLPEVYNRTLAKHVEHSGRYGYETYVLRKPLLEGFWSKPAYLLSIMLSEMEKPEDERLEWLFWFDLDVLVTNPNIPLETFLPPVEGFEHINMIITEDAYMLNSGTFFVRVNSWSIQFLADVLAITTYRSDKHPNPDCPDQRAFVDVLREDHNKHNVSLVPQRWFNAYIGYRNTSGVIEEGRSLEHDHWRGGDFELHFAGTGGFKDMIPAFVDYVEANQDSFAVPLNDTGVPEAVAEFWANDGRVPQEVSPAPLSPQQVLHASQQRRYAFATLLASSNPEPPEGASEEVIVQYREALAEAREEDYFTAVRMLGYQLLHDPDTRTTNNIPFLVLVTPEISVEKRQRLELDGATVIEVAKVQGYRSPNQQSWQDTLAKIRLFELVQYEKIAFLDADTLVVKQMDGIFDDPAAQFQNNRQIATLSPTDETPQPPLYIFAAASEQWRRDHVWPPARHETLNSGCFVLAPSTAMFEHYMSVLLLPDRIDIDWMDQGLFNYVHRREGNMPWQQIEGPWNVNWPSSADAEHGAASLHEKWWEVPGDDQGMVERFHRSRFRMEGYYARMDADRT